MKIVKPMKLALLKKTYTFLQKHYLAVSPLCFFNLRSGEVLVEMPQWSVVQGCLGPTGILDFAMPKTKGEVLLAGNAFSPKPEGVQRMQVRLQVGDIDKTLQVTGERVYRRGLLPLRSISEPEPFTKMGLHAGNSFGGAGYALNPAGKGYITRRQRLFGKSLQVLLPNIEDPRSPMKKISRRPQPAGFAPTDITLPPRVNMAGTYDDQWRREHFPGYAPDIDWDIFNAAPLDQQQENYWRGDEDYCLTGLHPSAQQLTGKLPAIRTRVFVRDSFVRNTFVQDKQQQFSELETVLDTLWFFPEVELGVMIFRGWREIADSDGLDVSDILLAYENLADPPRPADYYRHVLTLRTDKATALAHVFNESQLSPLKDQQQIQREADELARAKQKLVERQQQLIAELESTYGTAADSAPEPALQLPEFPVFAPEAIARNDIDLSQLLAIVEQQTKLAQQYGEDELNTLRKIVKDELPALVPAQPAAANTEQPSAEQIAAQLREVKARFYKQQPILEWMQNEVLSPDDLSAVDMDALLKLRRFSPQPTEPKQKFYPEVKAAMRAIVEDMLISGESLAERDMAGFDLSGLDFSHSDLHGVLLESADLSAANFSNCNLREAVFTGCLVDNAAFVGADLSGANLAKAVGMDADFSGARFDETWLTESQLTACQFTQCRFDNVVAQGFAAPFSDFSGSDITRGNFIQSDFHRANFKSAKLRESLLLETTMSLADFSEAQLFRCAAMKTQANLAAFNDASLERVQTGGDAQLLGAQFQRARIKDSGFRQVNLKGADFRGANISQSDLGGSDLSYCNFSGTRFTQAVLSASDISHCDCSDANFYQSKARKTQARETVFDGAEFLHADWQQASWQDCRYDGVSNLNRTCLEISP